MSVFLLGVDSKNAVTLNLTMCDLICIKTKSLVQ